MKIATSILQKIDNTVGWPICIFLSLWCALVQLFFKPKLKDRPRNVLIIKFFGLGSIYYSTLIPADLRRQYGDVRITLLTFEENRGFVEHLGAFDKIVTIDKSSAAAFLQSTLTVMFRNLLMRPYDICLDLEYFSKYTTIHTTFTRAPLRIGFYQTCLWRHFTYTSHCHFNTTSHISRIYGQVSELAGVAKSENSPAPIPVSEAMETRTKALLTERGWDGQPFVGVNVNASDLALGRRWAPDRFVQVIEAAAKSGYPVFLTGAPNEQDFTQECLDRVDSKYRDRVVNLAGELDLMSFLAFLKITFLFITNDSGPMIFASGLNTPTVSLWGPGDPKMYGGAPPAHSAVYSDYPCSPCMYVPATRAGYFCGYRFPCMEAISTEAVLEVVTRRLQSGRDGESN
jgi:ADP-heptose:LPS heptosyltransferase